MSYLVSPQQRNICQIGSSRSKRSLGSPIFILQKLKDGGERETAKQSRLQLHESLHAYATQVIEYIDASFALSLKSINNKHLGVSIQSVGVFR